MNSTLPPELHDFGEQLNDAITRELGRKSRFASRRSRRGRARLAVAASCVIAAVVAVALLTTAGPSRRSTSSQHVLRAAEYALPAPKPHTILHVSVTQTMTPGARRDSGNPAAFLTAQGWFQLGGAREAVTEQTEPGKGTIWQSDGRLYDTATHRVYASPTLPDGHPHYTIARDGNTGRYTLRVDGPNGPVEQPATAAEVHALRDGTDVISWAETWNGHRARLQPLVSPDSSSIKDAQTQQPDQVSLAFSAELHRLLQSGRAQVKGLTTVDGRATIQITLPGADGRPWQAYYVDPHTYAPVAYDIYNFGTVADRTRVLFHAYDRMPLKHHTQLLRLPVPAGTPVVHNPTQYFRHSPAPLFFW